jgi:hypothetical protein
MGFDDSQIEAGLESIPEEKPTNANRYKSKAEQLYAWRLDDLKRSGAITWWGYEAMKFRLADPIDGQRGAWYTPDFIVVLENRVVECHEVKGHLREAARLRFLMASQTYHWHVWRMIRRDGASWKQILCSPGGEIWQP